MTWVRFEDRFPWHRKVRGLSDSAFRLHVSAVCWSVEHLTDGKVLRSELHLLSDVKRPTTAAKELTTVGLWDENDERTGWELHDFLVYNESRFVVLARREADAERKRKFREAKPSPAQTPPDGPNVQPDSERTPAGQDAGLQAESTLESERTTPTHPDPVKKMTTSSSSDVAPRTPKAKRATSVPDIWPPDTDTAQRLTTWAAENAPAVDLRFETAQWQDWHRATGVTRKDWVASWRNWMGREQKRVNAQGARSSQLALVRPTRPSASDAAATAALEAGARVAARHAAREGA